LAAAPTRTPLTAMDFDRCISPLSRVLPKLSYLLLDAGAEVDATNRYGNTPLFVAVFNSRGNGSIIRLLRAHGANPYAANGTGQNAVGLARAIANYPTAQLFDDLD
jgi:hypothetical protein